MSCLPSQWKVPYTCEPCYYVLHVWTTIVLLKCKCILWTLPTTAVNKQQSTETELNYYNGIQITVWYMYIIFYLWHILLKRKQSYACGFSWLEVDHLSSLLTWHLLVVVYTILLKLLYNITVHGNLHRDLHSHISVSISCEKWKPSDIVTPTYVPFGMT